MKIICSLSKRETFSRYVLIALLLCGNVLMAASRENVKIPHIPEKIIVDGEFDELVWQQARVFELNYETKPGENTQAPVRTTVYLYEDGENLNLAFIAYDDEPEKIIAHYHDHDFIFDDDLVGFKVDTFNDTLHSYQFFANYLGVMHDSIQDDVKGSDDLSWNAIWESAGKKTAHGYQVEFSIPLKILRFDDSKTEQTWGFDLLRFYPRDVRHRIALHEVDRNISCDLCQNPTFTGLKNLKNSEDLIIVPFLTATEHQQRRNPAVDSWQDNGVETDFGVDVRWGFSADTTLNATINPDFSQVESDVAQLDVNQTFSLFFLKSVHFLLRVQTIMKPR